MTEFEREHRYWVIKRKHLTPEKDEQCRQFCGRLSYEGVPEVEAVVVESDWPIYEIVWHLVERLATGQRLPFITDEYPEAMKAERDALAAHVDELRDRAAQARCGCEHPFCKRCQASRHQTFPTQGRVAGGTPMTTTLPNYTGRMNGGQSETKHQQRVRNDNRASHLYTGRVRAERLREQRDLAAAINDPLSED